MIWWHQRQPTLNRVILKLKCQLHLKILTVHLRIRHITQQREKGITSKLITIAITRKETAAGKKEKRENKQKKNGTEKTRTGKERERRKRRGTRGRRSSSSSRRRRRRWRER